MVATGFAGAGFALLRLRARSVVAPIVVHAAVNMVTFAGVRLTADPRSPGRGEVATSTPGAESDRGRDLFVDFRPR